MPAISSLNENYSRLISQTIQYERQPQFELKDQRNEEERFRSVLDDFDSKLSSLHGQLESLTDPLSNPFEGVSATADSDAFSVSASDDASFGNHSVEVKRLASTDARLSKQYTGEGGGLRTFFDDNGAQSFSIGVSTPTSDDPEARTDISVTVDPTGATNEEILKEIGDAIDTAMEDAVNDGTLKRSERASVSTVNETSDTTRLSLRSGKTGYDGRLTFTDSANGLLGALEVNANNVVSGTGGGQVTDVGTSETNSQLNSEIVLDGLTLYRSSNSISDALDGVTLDLQETSEEAGEGMTSLKVAPDKKGIKSAIESFISKYNGAQDYIKRKSNVDGESGTRGDFAGERAFTGLRYGMRNDINQTVSGLPDGSVNRLSQLGIEAERDGTLSIEDEDALMDAIEKDPEAVGKLFSSEDGVAQRLTDRLDRFIGSDGLIGKRQDNIDTTVDRLDDRITAFDERLARREEQLRQQYSDLQNTMAALQSQQQSLMNYGW